MRELSPKKFEPLDAKAKPVARVGANRLACRRVDALCGFRGQGIELGRACALSFSIVTAVAEKDAVKQKAGRVLGVEFVLRRSGAFGGGRQAEISSPLVPKP